MEAMAGASRCGVVGGACFRHQSVPSTSTSRCVDTGDAFCHVRYRAGRLDTALHTSISSAAGFQAKFQDQGHEQFYRSVQRGGRGKDRLKPIAAGLHESVETERNISKAKKTEKKMHKKLKKAAARAAAGGLISSSSSSSSESEADEHKERRVRRTRRIDMESFEREWERISRSPLMSSIPSLSPTFEISERPQGVAAAPVMRTGRDDHDYVVLPSPAVDSEEFMARMMRMSSVADVAGSRGVIARPLGASPAPVEVCMGGKCKRAGAEDVMAALQANGVPACGAKCMKKCKLAVNVRLHHEDDGHVAQMFSGVGVSDVHGLSQKHFRAGALSRDPRSPSPMFDLEQN